MWRCARTRASPKAVQGLESERDAEEKRDYGLVDQRDVRRLPGRLNLRAVAIVVEFLSADQAQQQQTAECADTGADGGGDATVELRRHD